MQNITLSADAHLIQQAREKARAKKTTINAEFRSWLQEYVRTGSEAEQRIQCYRDLMEELSAISTGGKSFSRDEMNERR